MQQKPFAKAVFFRIWCDNPGIFQTNFAGFSIIRDFPDRGVPTYILPPAFCLSGLDMHRPKKWASETEGRNRGPTKKCWGIYVRDENDESFAWLVDLLLRLQFAMLLFWNFGARKLQDEDSEKHLSEVSILGFHVSLLGCILDVSRWKLQQMPLVTVIHKNLEQTWKFRQLTAKPGWYSAT